MGRKLSEIKSIEKNKRKSIETKKRLKKIKADAEKLNKKPVKILNEKGEVIRIIKNY